MAEWRRPTGCAPEVAQLPAAEREERDSGDGTCFRCGKQPSTRFIGNRPGAERTGIGFPS